MATLKEMHKFAELSQGASDFVKLGIGMLRARKSSASLRELADLPGHSPKLRDLMRNKALPMMLKGGATSTSDLDMASVATMSNAFLASVGQYSAFERLLADNAFLTVPLRAFVRVASSQPVGETLGEGVQSPVLKMTSNLDPLEPEKVQAIIAVDEDTLKIQLNLEVTSLIGSALRKALGRAVDDLFLSLLTSGAVGHTASGSSAADVLADLDTAIQSIEAGSDARYYFIVPSDVYRRLAIAGTSGGLMAFPGLGMRGGAIGNIAVIPSDAAGDGILFDASQVAVGSGGVELDTSIEAALALDDNPTSGTPLVSLFQFGYVGLKATRYFNCKPLRSNVVAKITGMGTTA